MIHSLTGRSGFAIAAVCGPSLGHHRIASQRTRLTTARDLFDIHLGGLVTERYRTSKGRVDCVAPGYETVSRALNNKPMSCRLGDIEQAWL